MAIIDHFQELDRSVLTGSWTAEERRSLLCIVREIHRCDGAYSPEERREYDLLLSQLEMGAETDEGALPSIAEAVGTLKADSRKMSLLYIWMAEAVLADGRYDEREQSFLDGLCSKYELSRTALERTIRELQLRDVDDVLRKWLEDTYWDPTSEAP